MRVITSRGDNISLSEFLEPSGRESPYEGELEALQRVTRETQEAMGRLLAYLVERRVLAFEEAAGIAGVSTCGVELKQE